MFSLTSLVSLLSLTSAVDIWPEKPADLSTPVGVRLGLGSSNSVNVGWSSYAEPQGQVCVLYGTNELNLSERACSTNYRTYGTSRVWYNQVELTGLQPAQQYYYRINTTNSTTIGFKMTRAPGDKTPYSFVSLADLGYHSFPGTPKFDNHPTARRWYEMREQYDLSFYPGDYAYADDFFYDEVDLQGFLDGEDAYQSLLERFYDLISPITSSQPFMITAGNHEATCVEMPYVDRLCPKGQQNFTDIRNRYSGMFPRAFDSLSCEAHAVSNRTRAKELAVPPFWYSFESGLVHYVFVNTETDFENAPDGPGQPAGLDSGPFGYNGQQLEWLKADLASVDRSITPWVIVGGHRPWYTTAEGDNRCESCMEAFEDIFYQYGVDLVIMGHVHNSQRFQPIYRDEIDPNGYNNPRAPMYIIVGGAGNSEGLDSTNILNWAKGLDWADGSTFAFAIVDINNSTDLSIRFISSDNGTTIDHSDLHKNHEEQFVRQISPNNSTRIIV